MALGHVLAAALMAALAAGPAAAGSTGEHGDAVRVFSCGESRGDLIVAATNTPGGPTFTYMSGTTGAILMVMHGGDIELPWPSKGHITREELIRRFPLPCDLLGPAVPERPVTPNQ